MLTKIGMGILGYILGFYFIIFITVLMLKFLCRSFVGISLSEACHMLVWGEVIDKEDYEELLSSTHKEELTKNEAINDLLEDSSHYKESTYVEKTFGEMINWVEKTASIDTGFYYYKFNNLDSAVKITESIRNTGYDAYIKTGDNLGEFVVVTNWN